MDRIKLHIKSIFIVLAAMPLAHSAVKTLALISNGTNWFLANLFIGLLGLVILYKGLSKKELSASLLGFLSAHLIFIGFFEATFAFFAKILEIQPLVNPKTGNVVLSPGLQIVELSVFFAIPLFLMMFVDNQVRCNMLVWTRKAAKLDIAKAPFSNKFKNYALVSSRETLFSIWIIYGLSILTLDHRVLGMDHPITGVLYLVFLLSPFYLCYKIIKLKAKGIVFRYSIPLGILLWTWVETLASMKIIKEFYLYPREYPVFIIMNLVLFIILFFSILKEDKT